MEIKEVNPLLFYVEVNSISRRDCRMDSSYQNHGFFFFFFGALVFLYATVKASKCERTCGASSVSFPFGFSGGCLIRLNCSAAGEKQLGGYRVRNITSEKIVLDVPPVCNRPVGVAAEGLFGRHHAATSNNALFLRGCQRDGRADCRISTEIISRRLNLTRCGPQGDNINCFSSDKIDELLPRNELSNNTGNCKFLFAAVRYSKDDVGQASLVFGEVEVGWWLDGECRCAANARCTHVRLPQPATRRREAKGFRCSCREGFVGDGFTDGEGCRRVEKCSSSSSISGSCKGGSNVGVLVGGIAAGVSLLLGLAFLCHRIRRRRLTICKGEETTQRLLSQTSCAVTVYSLKDVLCATSNFSDASKIGVGAYATVYVGKFSQTGLVAIKRLKHPDVDHSEHVINEVKLISSVSHPNLVHLLGCCIERGEHILVYEFVSNGTLSQHLHRQRGEGLPWSARVSIAAETASAVAHLHTAVQPPIYHRDIKSSNILLDYDLRPKLSDFGLSRAGIPLEDESLPSHISTAPQGTPGYVDPQYHQNFHLSDKSDVYSFGVVLVEMMTAMKVVDFRRAPEREVNLASLAVNAIGKGQVEDIVDPFIKGNWDDETKASMGKVAELAFRCLEFHQEVRPSMAEVAEELERIRKGLKRSQAGGSESMEVEKAKLLGILVSPVSVHDYQLGSSEQSCSSNGSMSNPKP
ncbi:wall-associated receptor kinase-like 21 [Curcuma longa]|uniref:wall-associated receptor kinase-like 21 n=1 Tax=Curcuma longa TaxID=136217 RepID=UPI003D9E55AA